VKSDNLPSLGYPPLHYSNCLPLLPRLKFFSIQGRGDSTRSRMLRGTCLVRQEGNSASPPRLPIFLIYGLVPKYFMPLSSYLLLQVHTFASFRRPIPLVLPDAASTRRSIPNKRSIVLPRKASWRSADQASTHNECRSSIVRAHLSPRGSLQRKPKFNT